LISWKNSFKRLRKELETTRKKREALDSLLNEGKISQSTYDLFNEEIDEAVADIENQQRDLLDKMNGKMKELEEQAKTLEMMFANFEIQHVTGEVDEDVYQREIGPLSLGLETAKSELDAAKEAVNQLSSGIQDLASDVSVKEETEPQTPEKVDAREEQAPVVEVNDLSPVENSQEQAQPSESVAEEQEKKESQ
jgi:polyhydroxyalkanoate synthesis regulator phasin